MAMLNFKKGLFSALPTTISEGTIYVTTDEKAMYVDISSTERIRLGQICVVDTVEAWEGLKPPYSQEAFYYIVESNALMRNNGTAEAPVWTQLNSVSDITADLSSLTNRMDTAEKNITAASTAAAAAQATADKGVEDAATAQATANEAKTAAETAQTAAENAQATADEAKGIAEQGVEDAKKAQTTADAAATAVVTAQTTADDAKTAAGTAQTTADEAKAAAEKAQATADQGVADAKTASDAAAAAQTRADNAYALADAANTAAVTANTNAGLANDAAAANRELIDAQEERLQAVEDAIGTGDGNSLADRIGALEETVNDPASGVAKNYERLNGIDTKFASYSTTEEMNTAINDKLADYSTTEEANTAINNKLASYSTTEEMTAAITEAKNSVTDNFNTKFESYSTTEEMNSAIDSAIESAIAENDAMTYRGVVTINDETGEDNLPSSEVKIGDTYKVSKTGYYGPNDELCYVGDLLIANSSTGKEESDGYIASENLVWDHVESGYEEENQPSLTGDNGNIYLSSPVATGANVGDLGKIAVMSMNENLKVSVASNAITMSLEWGSFETEETV